MVLKALKNASVVTDPTNKQIVNNGGPADIRALVQGLGEKSDSAVVLSEKLSSGVAVFAKPSKLLVPPWQMVSAELGGVSLRAATRWASPQIYSTTTATKIECWDPSLGAPGAVAIATTRHWGEQGFGLTGGGGTDHNHAKIGVSTSGDTHYTILGDMNQQGAISGECGSSQNGRGGFFFVLQDDTFWSGITNLIAGESAPTKAAPRK
jgi:hypothetical protein